MAEQTIERVPKRQGESLEKPALKLPKSTVSDLLEVARKIWNRGNNGNVKCDSTEDRDFREFFGCSLSIAGEVWDMLRTEALLPEDGMPRHLLCALMLMKIYGKEKTLCTLAGGIDKKTFRKWAWLFIIKMADLESSVVSNHTISLYYNYISTKFF